MAHAALSPEGRIQSALLATGCSQRQFAEIAACMGVPVSPALVNLCLSGKRAFTAWTSEQLLALSSELIEVRDYFRDVPINWGTFEGVSTMIVSGRRHPRGGSDSRSCTQDPFRVPSAGRQSSAEGHPGERRRKFSSSSAPPTSCRSMRGLVGLRFRHRQKAS